jgi:pimeloyl-ACP methyl ester carboxylesterase
VIEPVEFRSEGAMLRGLLLRPDAATHPPVVIMAHGTSATIRMVADEYAEVFRRNGFAVLLYDHRNLGASGGEPRQEINPWIQCRGYLDAIDFVQTLDGIDRDRIGLWGDSYSGGEVLVVGAVDERVTAIVAQTPVCGSEPPAVEPTRASFAAIRASLLDGDVAVGPEMTVGPLPVVSADQLGAPSLLEPVQAFRWFIEHGARHGSGWVNRVTRAVPDTAVPYSPVLCAPYVTPPTLMMVAPQDEMIHADYGVARMAYELMPAPKEWYDIDGGHFGLLYHPGPLFDEATRIQTEFLKRRLSRLTGQDHSSARVGLSAGLSRPETFVSSHSHSHD